MGTPEFEPNDFSPGVASKGMLPAEALNLPEGAKQFIRQYMPDDDDKSVVVSFETVSEFKPFLSQAEGREIYADVIYIRKSVRGNDKLEVVRPVREEDKRAFPFSWQEYLKGNQAAERGTNISKLPGVDAPALRQLHAKNIFTIEDMSLVNDSNLQNLGVGARELRRKAQEYLDAHKGAAQANELKAIVEKQSADLAKALDLITKLSEENAKLQKHKPGPKPRLTE